MKVLKKIYEDGKPKYKVKTDLGLIVKVTVSDEMSEDEIDELIKYVCNDIDIQYINSD